MYYAILDRNGKVHDVECDPSEIEDRKEELGGSEICHAETIEAYRKKRAKDPTGKAFWGEP